MYRVTLICFGVDAAAGPEAAVDIEKEFSEHRTWHARVTCGWDGKHLQLRSENDFDSDGQATLDEFGDCISAYLSNPGSTRIEIQSIEQLGGESVH